MTRFFVGTSGFAFKEWKGPFYPEKLPDAQMLSFYAGHFPAVELNNTFYRMPREKNLVEWAGQVPDDFRFALKATQRITHHAQLNDVGELLGYLTQTYSALGEKLGPTLFQLPPFLRKDLSRLEDFLAALPKRWQTTIEFRHQSWLDDEHVIDVLRAHDAALCITDQADLHTPLVATAGWGYLRLHAFDYDDVQLEEWARKLRQQPWTETYVFFKHDHGPGSGPPVADLLLKKLTA